MPMTLLNHVGVTVPDIDAAFAWYRDVLGLYPHRPPEEVVDDGSHFGNLVTNLFGPRLHGMRIAHLTASDGLGVELFEFTDPATEAADETFAYWRTGIFHFCLTVEDVTATAAAIAARSVPTAQMPTLARRTPRTAAGSSGEKKSANAGSATMYTSG